MYVIEQHVLATQPTAVVRAKARLEEIPKLLAEAYTTVAGHLTRNGVPMAGNPFARYRMLGHGDFEVEAGFPVAERIEGQGLVTPSELPAGPAVSTWHIGPYDTLGDAYEFLATWVERHGGTLEVPWEVYYSDPETEPDPTKARTQVFQPYR